MLRKEQSEDDKQLRKVRISDKGCWKISEVAIYVSVIFSITAAKMLKL